MELEEKNFINFAPSRLFEVAEVKRKRTNLTKRNYYPIFLVSELQTILIQYQNKHYAPDVAAIRDAMGADEYANSYLLNEECIYEVEELLNFSNQVKILIGMDLFEFGELFLSEIKNPPLELLWLLDVKCHLLSLASYLMRLTDDEANDFSLQFLSFAFSTILLEKVELKKNSKFKILSHFIEVLLIANYMNPCTNEVFEKYKQMAKDILSRIVQRLIDETDNQFYPISVVIKDLPTLKSTKKMFYCDQLTNILTYEPRFTINEVIQHQLRLTFIGTNSSRSRIIAQILSWPEMKEEVDTILNKVIRSKGVNWELILLTFTVWKEANVLECISCTKEIIKSLLKTGIATQCEDEVASAFVIARHFSLMAPENFPRYETWYCHTFQSDVYSPIKEKENFMFFAQLLTSWIQFEPPTFLQVQTTYWPSTPKGLRSIWSDYVAIAKVRISEYNEIEDAMEIEINLNDPLKAELDGILKTFEKFNRLPHSVAEMYLFKKEYYYQIFLPNLLKKPIVKANTDVRLRFIEYLNSTDKIPRDLYREYKTGKK